MVKIILENDFALFWASWWHNIGGCLWCFNLSLVNWDSVVGSTENNQQDRVCLVWVWEYLPQEGAEVWWQMSAVLTILVGSFLDYCFLVLVGG